ncbi:RNA polymerase sigma24 factor [Rhizocola hellebori]|uniref:RNA polymerase sigma24 factor n=1 Tax=Rhizocola hellebori TaxID=1392758 RepID=A0A8J3Q259_9ACTN|nr:SigE family RNA polymerase sigma factor [Rhizocola hellebori]GIH01985.1 RNA polymerase sigma24 factor [Rhizocola hellebori]
MNTAVARAAFEEFVAARSAVLIHVAYLLTGDRHDAEDLLQVALARVAQRWGRVEDPEAYVRRTLYTQSVSRLRALSRRPRESLGVTAAEPARHPDDLDLRVALDQALRKLTSRQRAVLMLRFYEDLSESQTAQMLGCAVGTVKSQTRHALSRLKALNPRLNELFEDAKEVSVP